MFILVTEMLLVHEIIYTITELGNRLWICLELYNIATTVWGGIWYYLHGLLM